MFGVFRTLLAGIVVVEHLGPIEHLGPYAVFAFYTLSGYLMSLIMHETYGYTARGFGRFAANRLLRIYPPYAVAAVLTLLLVAMLGEPMTREFHGWIGFPAGWGETLRNALLILRIDTATRLVPPAWALTVELAFYLAIGFGLSRWASMTTLWFAASLAYTVYLVVGGATFSYRYYTFAAASLPFATGACLYHLRAHGVLGAAAWGRGHVFWMLLTGLLLNFALGESSGRHAEGGLLHFYLNLALSAGMIAHLSVRPASRSLRKLDGRVGDLSYPIYLLHFQGGLLVLLVFPGLRRGDIDFMLYASAVTLGLALAVNRFLEPAVQRLRDAVRPPPRALTSPVESPCCDPTPRP